MFGFSLGKLLVLALIVGAVWLLFRFIGQRTATNPVREDVKPEIKAFDTEYDKESDTFVVRDPENRDK
jgi:hypothetical protein